MKSPFSLCFYSSKVDFVTYVFSQSWVQAHDKIRPAASATAVERSLGQIRYFVNTSVPEIKKKMDERNAAKLDAESYRRRLEEMQSKTPNASKLPSLKQKFETANARFEALNSTIKVGIDPLREVQPLMIVQFYIYQGFILCLD